eukprot:TRINITY_DN30444_c0_g1_i1.p1 TRINITY_DN30444_c0_g1~~TRINITY_DN30444_c0_g1_i1.p1  ORF type:complete len:874 (+),score=180.69 TRINITY_DN30444_c0_g1_i1:42-2663(+)
MSLLDRSKIVTVLLVWWVGSLYLSYLQILKQRTAGREEDTAEEGKEAAATWNEKDSDLHRKLCLLVHSEEIWGAKKWDDTPANITVGGVVYTVEESEVGGPLDACDVIVLLNSGLVPLSLDEPTYPRPGERRVAVLLEALVHALRNGAHAAGCTILAPSTILSSGYELLSTNASSWLTPRLLGEDTYHSDVTSDTPVPVSLLSADCLALDNTPLLSRTGVCSYSGAPCRASQKLRILHSLTPTIEVLSHAYYTEVVKFIAKMKGHRNEILSARAALEKQREKGLDIRIVSKRLETAIRHLGVAIQSVVGVADPKDPPEWGWMRRIIEHSKVGKSNFVNVVRAVKKGECEEAARLLEVYGDGIVSDTATVTSNSYVQLKDWTRVGLGLSRMMPRVAVAGRASAAFDWPEIGATNTPQHVLVNKTHGDILPNAILGLYHGESHVNVYKVPSSLMVVWLLPCCGCCGFFHEALTLLKGLRGLGVDVRLGTSMQGCLCSSLPQSSIRLLKSIRIESNEVYARAAKGPGVVVVQHGVPHEYSYMRIKAGLLNTTNMTLVSRAMYEFTILPENHAAYLNNQSHEVWVPSAFTRDVMLQNDVTVPVRTLPEAVDTSLYHAKRKNCNALPPKGVTETDILRFGSKEPKEPFKFLSMFKWEERKGWDVLIKAFLEAFTAEDETALYIATIPHKDPGAYRDRIVADVERVIEGVAEERRYKLPHICVMHAEVQTHLIPGMFSSADAFVLPTRGEGWGLPILQALSTGLPTIATSWSGQMDFLDSTNSYLLKCTLAELPKDSYYGWSPDKLWAEPSQVHLVELLKTVYTNHSDSVLRVATKAQSQAERFGVRPVAKMWLKEFLRVANINTPPQTSSNGDWIEQY